MLEKAITVVSKMKLYCHSKRNGKI